MPTWLVALISAIPAGLQAAVEAFRTRHAELNTVAPPEWKSTLAEDDAELERRRAAERADIATKDASLGAKERDP
jgi:hypothetical protein